jgi:hypothetical protein
MAFNLVYQKVISNPATVCRESPSSSLNFQPIRVNGNGSLGRRSSSSVVKKLIKKVVKNSLNPFNKNQ